MGDAVGSAEGEGSGAGVGSAVGDAVGSAEGEGSGAGVGSAVGDAVGSAEGEGSGAGVGSPSAAYAGTTTPAATTAALRAAIMLRRMFMERTYLPFSSGATKTHCSSDGQLIPRATRVASVSQHPFTEYRRVVSNRQACHEARVTPRPSTPNTRKRPTDEHSHRWGASDCVSSSRGAMRRAHRYQQRGPLPRQPRPTRRSYPWQRGCQYEPATETVPNSRRGWLRWECQHPEPEWWAGQPTDSRPGSTEPER